MRLNELRRGMLCCDFITSVGAADFSSHSRNADSIRRGSASDVDLAEAILLFRLLAGLR